MSRRVYAALGAAGVLGGLYMIGREPKTEPFLPKTPAVASLEKRYSSAGGSKNHLPGSASALGDSESVEGRNGAQGMANAEFRKQLAEQNHGNAVVSRTKPS